MPLLCNFMLLDSNVWVVVWRHRSKVSSMQVVPIAVCCGSDGSVARLVVVAFIAVTGQHQRSTLFGRRFGGGQTICRSQYRWCAGCHGEARWIRQTIWKSRCCEQCRTSGVPSQRGSSQHRRLKNVAGWCIRSDAPVTGHRAAPATLSTISATIRRSSCRPPGDQPNPVRHE